MVSPSEEVSQPSSTPRLSVMSMKCLLHREPSRHFSLGKERNFSPKSLRLKARRSSTARPGLNPGSDPGVHPPEGGLSTGSPAQAQAAHWTCVVVAADAVSGRKSRRSAPQAGQRRERGEAASAERALSRPPASWTYIKVTSTSLIKR